jgi:hypothetical protein
VRATFPFRFGRSAAEDASVGYLADIAAHLSV